MSSGSRLFGGTGLLVTVGVGIPRRFQRHRLCKLRTTVVRWNRGQALPFPCSRGTSDGVRGIQTLFIADFGYAGQPIFGTTDGWKLRSSVRTAAFFQAPVLSHISAADSRVTPIPASTARPMSDNAALRTYRQPPRPRVGLPCRHDAGARASDRPRGHLQTLGRPRSRWIDSGTEAPVGEWCPGSRRAGRSRRPMPSWALLGTNAVPPRDRSARGASGPGPRFDARAVGLRSRLEVS